MNILVLNDEKWQGNQLLVQSKEIVPKIGQKINGIEIIDTPISFPKQNSYLLILKSNHNLKRNDNATITD